jgi:integrase
MPNAATGAGALTPRLTRDNATGIWQIRWTEKRDDGSWRSHSLSTRTKDRAVAAHVLQGFQVELMKGGIGGVGALPGAQPIEEILDAYELAAEMRRVGETQSFSLRPIRSFFGKLTVADVTPGIVARYVRERRAGSHTQRAPRAGREGGGIADSTLRRELSALSAALTWAGRKGIIPRTSVPVIDLPPAGAPREVFLTEREADDLWLRALSLSPGESKGRLTRISRFVALALDTGARAEAIEALEWTQVDLEGGWIDYRKPGERITTKRKARVPIAPRLRPVLERAKREAKGAFVCDQGSVRTAWETFVATTPYAARGLTRHDLRRTFASVLAARGVPLEKIALLLADTLPTVIKHYARFSPDYLKGVFDRRA